MSSIAAQFSRGYNAIASSFRKSFLFIAFFNILIFLPVLGHYFFSDDWLVIAAGKYGMEQLPPGDTNRLLFCPFFLATYSVEYFLFKDNAFLWHITNLLFHLLALFLLLKLLRKIASGKTAFLLALSFSCLTLNTTAVAWVNVGGYILFFASFLGLFYCLLSYGETQRTKFLAGAFCCAILACFLYENGIFASLAAFFYLRQNLKSKGIKFSWQREGLLLWPVVLYTVGFFVFKAQILATYAPYLWAPQPQAQPRFLTGLIILPLLIIWWVLGLLLPSAVVWVLPSKLWRLIFHLSFRPLSAGMVINFFVSLILASTLFLALSKERARKYRHLLVALGTITFFYAFVIAVGRGSTSGLAYTLGYNAHYCYLFSGYLTIIAASLIDPASFSAGVKKLVMPLAVIFILLNAFYSFKVNYYTREESKIFFQYKKYLADFVARHRAEPDFSFQVKNDVIIFFTTPPLPLAEIFCDKRYLTEIKPKYTLDMHETDFYKEYKRLVAKPPKVWYNY